MVVKFSSIKNLADVIPFLLSLSLNRDQLKLLTLLLKLFFRVLENDTKCSTTYDIYNKNSTNHFLRV
jgi:hypothetical protein